MTLDFCLLILLFPALLQDDLKRRQLTNSNVFNTLIWIPLAGPLLYFGLRPSLPKTDSPVISTHNKNQTKGDKVSN